MISLVYGLYPSTTVFILGPLRHAVTSPKLYPNFHALDFPANTECVRAFPHRLIWDWNFTRVSSALQANYKRVKVAWSPRDISRWLQALETRLTFHANFKPTSRVFYVITARVNSAWSWHEVGVTRAWSPREISRGLQANSFFYKNVKKLDSKYS